MSAITQSSLSVDTQFLIPLDNTPETFGITLGNIDYTITTQYNASDDGGWVMSIANATTGTVLASNIPLITGGDCLAGLEYLGIEGVMIVSTDGDNAAVPTFDDLGVSSNLYFFSSVVNG